MSKKISVDSDLHSTSSPPTSLSHVGDKHGTHYASAGDITSLSRPDSSEASGSSNQEAINHTASQMDHSSQGFQHGVDIDSSAHSDPTLRVHEESTVHEDTGKFEDTDVKELHQLFPDNEFRDSKMNVASKNDCDKSPRKISFGADSVIPDRLKNDSVQFTYFDEAVLAARPVVEEGKKIKNTDNMDATLAFKTSSHITQLTNDSDDEGLKHQDRIIDAGIHMKEMVESSGIDDFPVSDAKELMYNASESQPQAINAKNGASTSPLVTNTVSSSSSEERNNIKADKGTENFVCMYSPDGKLMSTFSQRCSSELSKPVQHFKGESLQCHTSYTMETAGKESSSGDAMPLATLSGVHSADAALTTTADDSSTTISNLSVLHSKDLVCTVDAKMIYSSKKALSVRFSDDVMEIPPPGEFQIGLNDSHENVFPTVDSDFNSLNIGTRPALDFSLDSMTDGTSITKVNANSLNGLRVTGSVEMMKLHKEKMNGYGKNDMFVSELSFQDDQNYQICEEREFKNIGEDSRLSALPALDSHLLSDSDKKFQQDFQIEQSSFITPHQSTDSAKSHAELQNNEDDLSEEPIETFWYSHQGSTEDLDSQIEIEETIERLNRPENHKGFGDQSVEHEQVLEQPVVKHCIESLVQSSEFETSMHKDLTYQSVEKGLKDIGEGSQSNLLSALNSHSISYRGENSEHVSQTEQFSLVNLSTDSVKSYKMNTDDQQSTEEQHTCNDLIELKPNIEEMDGNTKSLNNQKESQGDCKFNLPLQGRNGDQSIKIEEMGEKYLQSHESGTEDTAVSTELEHTIQRINMHEKHEGFGKKIVENEQVLAHLALNPCIESTGQSVQKAVHTVEPESESLYQEDQVCQGVEQRRLKNIGECSHSCLLPALDSHSLSHSGKICDLDFQIEQSIFITPHQYTDSAESLTVTDLQSKVEGKEDAGEKSIEPQVSYALTDPASNDLMEFKLPIEEAERNTKIPDHQIELQGYGHKLDLPIQLGADEKSFEIEERGKTRLQAHKSSDENLTGNTELEHTIESSKIHNSHEVSGIEPFEHDKSVLNPCIESAKQSGHQIVQASEAEFELSYQEEENYQNVEERGFKGIGEGSHSCLLPALDIHSDSKKCKILQQDLEKEKSSVKTLHQTTDSAEFYFMKVMECQSMEMQPSYDVIEGTSNDVIEGTSNGVIEGTSNDVIEGTSNDVIELKQPISEAEEKHTSIDYQKESQAASPKLDHLIQDGTDEQFIKTEETGETHLQSHKCYTEEFASSRDIEQIERFNRHENHERLGVQLIGHDPVLQKPVGKMCTESIGQEAQPSESLRNGPPPFLEPFMSLHEAALKEPMISPVDAVDSSTCLKKVTLIDQMQEDGGPPLKNVQDIDVLSASTSDVKVASAKSEDSLSIRQLSLPSLIPSEHEQSNVGMFDDRTKCAEKEDCHDANQGKHDEEHSVPQMVTCKKDVSQPKINIRKLEEDLEPTLDISHFPGLKIKPRTTKHNLGPAGTGFLGPQDSLQKVIPPFQLLKMKQKRAVENISKAASNSPAEKPANQKQSGIGTIKDFQTSNTYKENGKVDSHKVGQSVEATLYSDSEGNDTQEATNGENKNAIKEVPNSSPVDGKDSCQQLQTKPASLLDEAENVNECGNTGKKSLPQVKAALTQTEGNIHQTSVGQEGKLDVHFDSVETKISKKEEGSKSSPYVIMSQGYDMSTSKPGSESIEKAMVYRDTKRIITGLTATACEGNTVDTKTNLILDDARKPLREDCLDRKTNDQKRDIAGDTSGKTDNSSDESNENNQSDCTMPSRLPEIYHNKNIEMELLEVSKGQDNTTNHPHLKDSDSLERRGTANKPYGYVEVYNKFPSDLLPRSTERIEVENISTNHVKPTYTAPSSFVDKVTQYEEMAAQSPGYGEFQYSTPSSPLQSVKKKLQTEEKSPVYCELYTTPTGLFDKHIQSRNISEQSPEYGEPLYTTPSDLFYRIMERNESENRSSGYGELMYTTPSRLLERQIQNEEVSSDQSPVYGEFQYTTPSSILHIVKGGKLDENRSPGNSELLVKAPFRFLDKHKREMADQSPMLGEFQYKLPSGLLLRERNEVEDMSPGHSELLYKTSCMLVDKSTQSDQEHDQSTRYEDIVYKMPLGLMHRFSERKESEDRSKDRSGNKQASFSRLSDMDMKRREIPDNSPGYGEFHYTTPSGLLYRAVERNEGENRFPGYCELPYTTPSKLLERRIQREEMPDNSPGYGEFHYTTPSCLLHRAVEKNKDENRSPGYCELPYTTPSRLLERRIQREEMPDNSPGYGEFHYTTPSRLLHRALERNEGENRSPGYCELPYTTPSKLLERHIQREEMPDNSLGYGEFHYTTPSCLLHRAVERNEGESRSPGYGELTYTTPSRLLERHIQREEMADNSPGYGEFLYTTPSGLVQRMKVLNEGENRSPVDGELKYTSYNRLLDRSTWNDNMSDQSPGYGEFQFRTPTDLLCSIIDRKVSSDENKHKASTLLVDLDMKGREIPNHSRHFEESLNTTPTVQRDDAQQASEDKSPRYGKFCYVNPSVLIYKDTKREDSKEKSQQSGKFQHKTPSELVTVERRKGERVDDKSSGNNPLRFSTPSLLLYQELVKRQNLDASSPGYRVPKQNTLIKVKSRTEDEGYATPSQILEKYNRAAYASQSSPCLEYHYSTTPSQMLVRSFDQKKPENVTQGYEFPSNISPSELFNRIQALKNGRSQLLENDVLKGLKYASEPLQIQMYRPYGIEYPLSDTEYRYSAPSRLLEVMEQRRPAELVMGRASSSRNQHPRDHNKYNEQNVRTEYKNPAIFFQKREDQARRPQAPDYEAFIDSTPLRLINLDDTTRPSLPAVLRDSDLEVQEEEAILYQYEYDNLVAADRNTSTGSYCMSDNRKPATVQYPPSFNKFCNEVYPAIPYPSTAAVREFQYKTPADVLHSVKENYGGEDRSPGYGKRLCTTPYRLLDRSTQTEIIFDQSPMFQCGPPSGLLFRVSDSNAEKDRSPSSGNIKYNGSAKVFDMDMKTREVTDHLPCFDKAVYTIPSGIIHREDANQALVQISPRLANFCDVTPSGLLHNNSMGEVSDQNSYQLGNFQYKMPSQLLAVEKKLEEIEDKSPGQRSIRYSTPSLLLYQELLRRRSSDVSSPGYVVPMQDTFTKVKSRTDEGYADPKNTTPSPILEKYNKVLYESQSSPHFENHFSRIPSQMLARNTAQETPENVTQGHELPDNVSPSELFNRIQALENGRSTPSEGEFDQYLRTPNPPLQMHMYRPNETEHLASDGEYQYSAPSRLLEVMEQRPAELMTGRASSSRHQHLRDHNKYNEQSVRTEYKNPAIFVQKREDQAIRPKAPDYEAFIDSTPLRLINLDDTIKLGQKSSPSAVLRDIDLEGQEKEAILYQHEYDTFVAADRNGNANNNMKVESSVDPDWEESLESIQHHSVANSQQLQSNVPAAVQHTLAQSLNKSDSEVSPTTQKLSRSNFKRSECTAAATNQQQASSQSFSKFENEAEHAEIIRRLMVVLGNTAVFLAAYTEQEIISLLTFMKKGQEPAGSPIQRDGYGSITSFLGNHEVKGPHHVAWMTSARTLKVLKASLTSESEADLYQVLVDIQSLLSCANSFMKEHGNISIDALIRSESDYHRSFGRMDVTEGARGMSEPYRWFFSEEFVQTTTLQEFLNMIQNTPQIESSHIVLKTKPFRNVRGGDVNSVEMTVPFQDSVHIQELFSHPVQQPRTHTSDVQFKHPQHPQKMDRTVSPWDISNISYIPSQTRNSVIWQNRDGSLSQSVSDFPDFSTKTLHSKKGSAFSLVVNPSFNLSSDEEDLDTESKWDTAKGQIVSRPEIKKNKTNKRLFKQSANKQSDGKKVKGGGRPGTSPDARSFMMEKELLSSQNRKLQGEINTLQTENTLLKEKYNRIRARIAEIENDMQVTQSELDKLLETSNQEITELTNSSRLANQKDKEQFENKILVLAKENESFKLETASLQKQVESSKKLLETIRQAGEKSKLLEAQKAELIAVNEQLGNMKEHLDQREQHFLKEEEQHNETREQIQKLTKITNLLQQQSGATDDEAVIDKQIQSLEKRLKVTEERLFQERADRANNLSQVEEKLLAENAQFQVIENDLSRKLQREKEKNRNLEKNIKDLREEIEKLHLALPFDESLLTLKKGNYSIPSNSHSSHRAESLRSNDMNYIMAQIKKEDGLGTGQEQDIIRELWNKRKLAIIQLHELEIQLVELGISDNIAEGLKNLRDNYGQAETKLKQMEEKLSDMQFEMAALENTYKQQLTALVHERHDAFAHLKTAEDLLEALKTENQSLKLSLTGSHSTIAHQDGGAAGTNAETELLRSQVQSLEGQLEQVISKNKLMEGELKMVNVQLSSRDQELQESKEELELLYASLTDNETNNSQQQTIDRLSEQVNHLNTEIGMLNDRNNTLLSEKEKLEDKLAVARKKEISLQKLEQQQKANTAQIEDLREELNEKDHKIENQKWQLHELDGQLQKVRQDLYMEQEHKDELEAEVESLQQTVTQRAQMFEALIGSEQEQLAQFQLLKDTLDSASKELDQKKTKVTSLELDLSLSKNRVEELDRDLKELRYERSYDTKFHPPPQSSMGDRLRIRELVGERTTLKQELEQLQSTVQLTKQQASQAQKELLRLESELVKAKTTILQLTAEKNELEKHLERTAEENDSLVQEWGQAEEDLVKLEKKLQEILGKFEQEARKQHGNFETRYVNIPADSRKLLNELDSLRLLLKGKEREAEMIKDRSMRQQMEVKFLQKKVELIQNQMVSNREDIARMVNQLASKMKEAVRTREINQFLVHERTKLKTENYHLENDLEKERETNMQMKKEIEEITKKIEMSQVQSKNTVKEAQDKDNLIATIEADLRNATRNLTHLELEVSQQKNKIERLNNDVKNLTNINSTLENRLETEKNTNQSQSYHEECKQLKEEVTAHKNHVDILRGQVLLGKDDLDKLKQEKESLRHEYEVLCRQLNVKEHELKLHKEESLHKLDTLQKELHEEKTTLENNQTLMQKELDFTRSELESLKEKLQHKEMQLQSFVRTLQELEIVTREKRELESNVQRLEGLVRDNKVILDSQRKEIMVHMEANAKHQEMLAKVEVTNQKLYGELRVHQENSQQEIHGLQITIKELQSQHEAERTALSESLSQSQSQLQASQSHLAIAADSRDKLQGRVRILERDLEEIKSKLSDESTGRHLTEHSVGSLRLQLEDTRNQKIVAEARLIEMEKALAKTESQLKMEKEKLKKLSGRFQEAEFSNHSTESSVKAKQEQVDLLQNENIKLRQMLESQKHSLMSKMKMTSLDIKQQLEMVQNERDKMSSQMQKLSIDLDQSREQIAMKNKENYKQQEVILALEDQLKECKFKLKVAEDSLKTETAVQDQLTHRYAEQEEELKVLKNFLAKKAEESGDADKAMWHEMNNVIQELSRQMHSHLESQKQNKDARETPTHIQKLKRQITDLQSELATERSLHQITRDSLQALEEDCKRLRHQLHVLRRRESSASDKKYKNRMEAINAIIAKSQSQAQALLASGGYHDDINSPRPDYNIYSPRMGYNSPSPRMGYSSPQRAFSPDNSVASDFSIASTGPMVPTFESSVPYKTQGRRN